MTTHIETGSYTLTRTVSVVSNITGFDRFEVTLSGLMNSTSYDVKFLYGPGIVKDSLVVLTLDLDKVTVTIPISGEMEIPAGSTFSLIAIEEV